MKHEGHRGQRRQKLCSEVTAVLSGYSKMPRQKRGSEDQRRANRRAAEARRRVLETAEVRVHWPIRMPSAMRHPGPQKQRKQGGHASKGSLHLSLTIEQEKLPRQKRPVHNETHKHTLMRGSKRRSRNEWHKCVRMQHAQPCPCCRTLRCTRLTPQI